MAMLLIVALGLLALAVFFRSGPPVLARWALGTANPTRQLFSDVGFAAPGHVRGCRAGGPQGGSLRLLEPGDLVRLEVPRLGRVGTITILLRLLAEPEETAPLLTVDAGHGFDGPSARLVVGPGGRLDLTARGINDAEGAVEGTGLEPGRLQTLSLSWSGEGLSLYVDGQVVGRQEDFLYMLRRPRWLVLGSPTEPALAVEVSSVVLYEWPPADDCAAEVLNARVGKQQRYAPPVTGGPAPVINAGDFYDETSPTCGLQEAVNACPLGGVVYLPAGEWLLRASVRLHSRMTLRGEGPATVLRRAVPELQVSLAEEAQQGALRVRVEDRERLQVGDEITLGSKEVWGWYCTHGRIVGRSGDFLDLDMPLWRTCKHDEGYAINLFAGLVAEGCHDVLIQDVTLDGVRETWTTDWLNYTTAAVALEQCTNCFVRGVYVRDWPSDGISVQGGASVVVEGCVVEGCRGLGLHPGTYLEHGLWIGNISRRNGSDGFFYCSHVRETACVGNLLCVNGRHGVGGLGGGGDTYDLVAANIIAGNAAAGVEVNGGAGHLIAANLIFGNSQGEPGRWAGLEVLEGEDIAADANHFCQETAAETQQHALRRKFQD